MTMSDNPFENDFNAQLEISKKLKFTCTRMPSYLFTFVRNNPRRLLIELKEGPSSVLKFIPKTVQGRSYLSNTEICSDYQFVEFYLHSMHVSTLHCNVIISDETDPVADKYSSGRRDKNYDDYIFKSRFIDRAIQFTGYFKFRTKSQDGVFSVTKVKANEESTYSDYLFITSYNNDKTVKEQFPQFIIDPVQPMFVNVSTYLKQHSMYLEDLSILRECLDRVAEIYITDKTDLYKP